MFKSKIIRVLPTATRGVSGKNGIIIVFEIDSIEKEVTRTFNLPTSPKAKKSYLLQVLRDLNINIPESSVLMSPYLFSGYISKMTEGLDLLTEVQNSGNPKYPWNITQIKLSNIHTEK